jgi:glycosyltransferase involved in cell wall biosynthesis
MRVDFVVPRYGREVVGGAEAAVRMLATRLAASPGYDVGVLTTCARDSRTWADEYRPGATVEDGVAVQRFASVSGRDRRFDRIARRVLLGKDPTVADQREFLRRQGPVNPAVVDAAEASRADVVVFSPYLYDPIVRGIERVGERAVLHPAAHDEPALNLSVYEPVFRGAGGLVFYTDGERRLVDERFGLAAKPQLVLGLGVDPPAERPDPGQARAALGLSPDQPYLVCVGRVDDNKGTSLLAQLFGVYKARRPGPLKLVFLGQVVDRPPAHPDVLVAGPVPEAVKWGAYAGALAFVTPSPYESFSLVLIEAWLAGAPALANRICVATREHVSRSGGGLLFGSYAEFEAALDRLVDDAGLRERLAGRGRAYAEGRFGWPGLLDRYGRFLATATERGRR